MSLDPNDPTTFTTEDGVVIKLKPVSKILIRNRGMEIPVPEPPMIAIHEKDDRLEPNYAAPSYIKAMQEYEKRTSDLAIKSLILYGTEVTHVPDGFPDVESKEWSDPLEDESVWGPDTMQVPVEPKARYIFWMSYIVLAREDELVDVTNAIQSLGGAVTQQKVLEAMDSFRGDVTGPANTGVGAPNRAARRRNRDSK